MDQERERIQADLRGLLEGEVHCDDVFLQLYASDASIYEVRPIGVVRPRSTADVVACVQYAAENEISLHARGAGTGVAGESLGRGLVLDFAHSMRRILHVSEDTVCVQPGVVLGQLNQHLRGAGRLFGPDPATREVTTMGSVLALDGSGSHWPIYGSAADRVVSMQVVLASGEVIRAARHPVVPASSSAPGGSPGAASGENPLAAAAPAKLVQRLAELLRREEAVIAQHLPRTAVNGCGYHLKSVLEHDQLDLARLLVGSEGTLALITEATVRTDPLPNFRGVTLLFFERLEAAARGALEVKRLGSSTCDLMDRRLLSIARETDVRYDLLIPPQAEAMLLVGHHAESLEELRQRMRLVESRLQRRRRLAFAARSTMEPDECALYWSLAKHVVPRLYRLKGSERPLPFIEDIAVPPEALPGFLARVHKTLKAHEVTASLFAHASHGQLHIRPFLDLGSEADIRRMHGLASDLYEEVLEVGGTISGEHGDGLSRTWYVRRQYGPLYDVFREIKRTFDPQNLFNPGKVVADAPQPLTKNLRPVQQVVTLARGGSPPEAASEESPQQPLLPQLVWDNDDLAHAARSCNGCGRCRTQEPDERMCPIYRFAPKEEATPRAKANLVRAVLTGQLELRVLADEQAKAIADLCVHCYQCRQECPASVDIPKLMAELKGQFVATNGLRFSDGFMTRLETLARWGSLATGLVNWALGNRQMRWLLEKFTGIAQGRKLPRLAARNYLRAAHRQRLTRPTRSRVRKVLYFVDTYANWFDTQLADALVRVMEHNGIEVFVPPDQQQSGMASVALGAIDRAKQAAKANVALLADAVRHGYHVVTTEPSAALCLTAEYPNLLDDDDARLVAQNTSEACGFLWKLHGKGALELDFRPISLTAGYHLPCHLKVLSGESPGENLLRLIPGLNVRRIERGCSGMAGTFGLQRQNYRTSLRAGWGLISALRDPAIQVGTTECSACKMQMEQGTPKPTIHPLKILALAYGLMPDVANLLTQRSEELRVT